MMGWLLFSSIGMWALGLAAGWVMGKTAAVREETARIRELTRALGRPLPRLGHPVSLPVRRFERDWSEFDQ